MTVVADNNIELPEWRYAHGQPLGAGKIKTQVDDFVVEEQLPFQPEGAGEHAFLQIEKCGENTEYVARLLARFAGVRQRDIGIAGLKDKHARTIQWFSVWLPGKDDPDWQQLETETIKVLQVHRHARKLKRGALLGNQFRLIIRQYEADRIKLEQRLVVIKQAGIPNYFGLQRFGRDGQNINKAIALFNGQKVKREQRSLYLSAARSYLFNQQLSARIEQHNWNKAVSGDVMVFNNANGFFKTDQVDKKIEQRIAAGEINPTAALFGKGRSDATADALDIETSVTSHYKVLTEGLIKFGLAQDRRALRVFAGDLQWTFLDEGVLSLSFFLPAGSYATSLVRELFKV